MNKLEKDIERECRRITEALGGRLLKLTLGERGWPDRTLILNGKISFVEFKKPGGRLSPHQQRWRDELRAQGLVVAAAYAVEEFGGILGTFHGVTFEEWVKVVPSTQLSTDCV